MMLDGKVALVTGATRGAGRGIARELGAAGATVYCTGRSTASQRSEMDRPETIEETAALIEEAGGRAIALQVDHLDPAQVQARRFTDSRTSTDLNPTRGVISSKSRTPANPLMPPAIGS